VNLHKMTESTKASVIYSAGSWRHHSTKSNIKKNYKLSCQHNNLDNKADYRIRFIYRIEGTSLMEAEVVATGDEGEALNLESSLILPLGVKHGDDDAGNKDPMDDGKSSLTAAVLSPSVSSDNSSTKSRALTDVNLRSEVQDAPYRDYSRDARVDTEKEGAQNFPMKLHAILSNPEFHDIIAWLPHGRAWRIAHHKAFEERVIPLFFRHGRYSSFARQVNGWNFRRITSGPDYNSYYHEMFIRGFPQLSRKMKRITAKESKKLDDLDALVPDLYFISRKHPLPELPGFRVDAIGNQDESLPLLRGFNNSVNGSGALTSFLDGSKGCQNNLAPLKAASSNNSSVIHNDLNANEQHRLELVQPTQGFISNIQPPIPVAQFAPMDPNQALLTLLRQINNSSQLVYSLTAQDSQTQLPHNNFMASLGQNNAQQAQPQALAHTQFVAPQGFNFQQLLAVQQLQQQALSQQQRQIAASQQQLLQAPIQLRDPNQSQLWATSNAAQPVINSDQLVNNPDILQLLFSMQQQQRTQQEQQVATMPFPISSRASAFDTLQNQFVQPPLQQQHEPQMQVHGQNMAIGFISQQQLMTSQQRQAPPSQAPQQNPVEHLQQQLNIQQHDKSTILAQLLASLQNNSSSNTSSAHASSSSSSQEMGNNRTRGRTTYHCRPVLDEKHNP
jgi:hypothetical protein